MWAVHASEKPKKKNWRKLRQNPASLLCWDAIACATWIKLDMSRYLKDDINQANSCFDQFRGFLQRGVESWHFPKLPTVHITEQSATTPIRDKVKGYSKTCCRSLFTFFLHATQTLVKWPCRACSNKVETLSLIQTRVKHSFIRTKRFFWSLPIL